MQLAMRRPMRGAVPEKFLLAGGGPVATVVVVACGKIILFAQTTIDAARNLGRSGTFHAAGIAAEQHSQGDLGMRFIGVADEPADA